MKNPSEILVKNVTVIDPNSPFNKKKVDILISNGTIKEIWRSPMNSSSKTKWFFRLVVKG